MELRDVAPGLWIWRLEHPDWAPHVGWPSTVTSTCVESRGEVARRYGAQAFGPALFWPDDIPETRLEPIEPGRELPGGLVTLYDGRGRNETPLWLPEQRALVFADALAAPAGELLIWDTPHIDRARAALRELLELPFELVIVAHGEPVHDRAAYERALELPPYAGEPA